MRSTFKNRCNSVAKVIAITLTLLTQAGCAAYKNKFECGPAGGLNCRSVEDIYAMSQNGEIWRHNKAAAKCKGKKCNKPREEDRIATNDGIIKVWIPKNFRQEEYRDGQYWYIPSQSQDVSTLNLQGEETNTGILN